MRRKGRSGPSFERLHEWTHSDPVPSPDPQLVQLAVVFMSRRLPVGLVPSDGQSSKGTVLDCHCVVCCRAPEDLTFDTAAIVSCSLALRIPGRLCSERAGLSGHAFLSPLPPSAFADRLKVHHMHHPFCRLWDIRPETQRFLVPLWLLPPCFHAWWCVHVLCVSTWNMGLWSDAVGSWGDWHELCQRSCVMLGPV